MFLLLILGRLLEPALGTPRFLVLYFASLLAGSFGALVVEPNALTIGASGAVFGLAGAVFVIARGRGMDALAGEIGFLIVFNLVLSFVGPRHQRRRPRRRPDRRRRSAPWRSSPARKACSGATGCRWRWRRWSPSRLSQWPARSRSPKGARRTTASMFPGGSTRSGWRMWPSSSTPSTSRDSRIGEQLPVHRVEPGRAEAGDPLPVLHRLRLCVLDRDFGHDDDDVGAEAFQLAPADGRRVETGVAGDVLAAGDRDHLRDPEAADAGRVEPLQGDHPRRTDPRNGGADRRQAPLELAPQFVGVVFHPRRLAQSHDLFEHLAERGDSHCSANIALNRRGGAGTPERVAIFTMPNGRGRPSPKYRAA